MKVAFAGAGAGEMGESADDGVVGSVGDEGDTSEEMERDGDNNDTIKEYSFGDTQGGDVEDWDKAEQGEGEKPALRLKN